MAIHAAEFAPALTALATYGGAYCVRARTLARRARPVPHTRAACFAAGIVVVAAAQCPPLDGLADETLTAHMAQHLLIGDIGALLVALGLTGPLLGPLLRAPGLRRLRPLGHPVIAFALWLLNLYAWHVPFVYQAALRHDLLHACEHAAYFWSGLLLWLALLGPLPKPRWFGSAARLGYVVAVRFSGAVLANVFIWAQAPIYPYYRSGAADQTTAGAVMMIEQMLLTILLLGWLFVRLAADDEARMLKAARREHR